MSIAKPLRYETAWAIYHVMPRGDGGKWKDEREMVAVLVRKRTAMTNDWIAARLGMGHEVSVTRAVRRFRLDPRAAKKLKQLATNLGM